MGLYLTVSKINGDFDRKSQIFPTRVFWVPAEGVPLGIGYNGEDIPRYPVDRHNTGTLRSKN